MSSEDVSHRQCLVSCVCVGCNSWWAAVGHITTIAVQPLFLGCNQANCSGCHTDTHMACLVLSFLHPACQHTSQEHESDSNIADQVRCLGSPGLLLLTVNQSSTTSLTPGTLLWHDTLWHAKAGDGCCCVRADAARAVLCAACSVNKTLHTLK